MHNLAILCIIDISKMKTSEFIIYEKNDCEACHKHPEDKHKFNGDVQQIAAVSKKKVMTIRRVYLSTLLAVVLIMVVAIFQIPTMLYYTDPPAVDNLPLEGVDLEACTVSFVYVHSYW